MRSEPIQLEIVAAGAADPAVARWLADEIGDLLPLRARLADRPLAPRPDWETGEPGRWAADGVLDSVVEWHDARGADPDRHWTLALAAADLAAPGHPFVFGVSTVGGCCALVGTARLRDGGDATAAALFRTRLLKEAVHEIGHLAGLEHCHREECVMFPSPGLAATDRKGSELCPRCRGAAATRLGDP